MSILLISSPPRPAECATAGPLHKGPSNRCRGELGAVVKYTNAPTSANAMNKVRSFISFKISRVQCQQSLVHVAGLPERVFLRSRRIDNIVGILDLLSQRHLPAQPLQR